MGDMILWGDILALNISEKTGTRKAIQSKFNAIPIPQLL